MGSTGITRRFNVSVGAGEDGAQKGSKLPPVPVGVEAVTAYFKQADDPGAAIHMAQRIHKSTWGLSEQERQEIETLALEGALSALGKLVNSCPRSVPGVARWIFHNSSPTAGHKEQACDLAVQALTQLLKTDPLNAVRSSIWAEKHFPNGAFLQEALVSLVAEGGRALVKVNSRLAGEAEAWVAARSSPCPHHLRMHSAFTR